MDIYKSICISFSNWSTKMNTLNLEIALSSDGFLMALNLNSYNNWIEQRRIAS